jgi:hypothetical protein
VAYVSGSTRTYQTGQTTTSVTVPTGTAVNNIVVVDLWVQWASGTVTPPSGFTLHTSATFTGSTRFATIYRYWKRLTAADTGTYAFTTATANTMAIATMWSGRVTSGSPFDTGTGATSTASAPSGANTAVACPNTPSITPTTAGVDLLYAVSVWSSGLTSNTVTSGWTDAIRNGTDGMLTAYKANQPASATGTVATSGSDNWVELLSALLPNAAPSPNPTAYLFGMPALGDVELTVDVTGTSVSHVYVALRTDGTFASTAKPLNGYFLDLYGSSSTFTVNRNVAGTTTTLATPSLTEQVGQPLHVRFRVEGADVYVRAWYGGTEPGSWTWSGTDGTPYLTAGKVSLGCSAAQVTFDDLAVTPA